DIAAGDHTDGADQLDHHEVHREVREIVRPRHLRLEVRRADRLHRANGRRYRSGDARGGVVLVLTDAGRDAEEQQTLADGEAPRLGLEVDVFYCRCRIEG